MATWDDVVELALALPEVERSTSFGTPSLKVRGRFLSRLRDDGDTIVVRVDPRERAMLLAAEPDRFYITPHYQNYPAMLVRLAEIDRDELREVLIESWLIQAPKRLRAAHEPALVDQARVSDA
jgi:hypothetical protein